MIIMMTMHTAAHIIVLWLSSWQDYDYNDNVYDLYFDKMMIRIITDDRIMIIRMTMIINITTTGCWSWSWWQTLTPVEPPLIMMVVSQLWSPGCTRWPLLYSLDAFLSERDIFMIWQNYLPPSVAAFTAHFDGWQGCGLQMRPLLPPNRRQRMKANSISAPRNPRNSWMHLSAG